jgi:sodium transport system permease protein
MISKAIIAAITQKELRLAIRDRRAFLTAILMPLLLPLVMFLLIPLLIAALAPKLSGDLVLIAVEGKLGDFAPYVEPGGLQGLVKSRLIKFETVPSADLAIKDDRFVAAIRMPSKLPQKLDDVEVDLDVLLNAKHKSSRIAQQVIDSAIRAYNESLKDQKLSEVGYQKLTPLRMNLKSIGATNWSVTLLGFLVPLFFVIYAMTGAQSIAIDASAAERERGTFETLLVAPISRLEVLLGKYFAVWSMAALATVMGLLGWVLIAVTFSVLIGRFGGAIATQALVTSLGTPNIGAMSGIQLMIAGVATSAIVSALALLPCLFARTYKEAQLFIVPGLLLSMALMIPAFFADLVSFPFSISLIPISGTIASMQNALRGQNDWILLSSSVAASAVFVAMLLFLMNWMLSRERVIFRS